MVRELEKLDDVGPSLREPGPTAVPEDLEARDGEGDEGLELGGLEGSTQQAVELPTHGGSTTPTSFLPQRERERRANREDTGFLLYAMTMGTERGEGSLA